MKLANFNVCLFPLNRHGLSVVMAIAVFIPTITTAQGILEEIVVTAQKREESLQDAPVAITAITGDDLERSGGYDPAALGDMVPNLHVGYEGNRDGVFITMRGVSVLKRPRRKGRRSYLESQPVPGPYSRLALPQPSVSVSDGYPFRCPKWG